jgi:hypothetical protein
MKNLILISRKPIVVQIFTLVCKKLHISLEVLDEPQIDHKVDIIIVDSDFISDRINIFKSYCKLVGAISKEELPYEIANDFLIPLPFLPSTLQNVLDEQLDILEKRERSKVYVSNVEVPATDDDNEYLEENQNNENSSKDFDERPELAVDYLEGLADNIATDMEEETDDSMVSITSVKNGGILDSKELSMIEDLINDSNEKKIEQMTQDIDENSSEDQWQDLSSVIDQAIQEVNMLDDMESKPLIINMNKYELDQLKPLLNLLDQKTIDELAEGKDISMVLRLGTTSSENE